MDAFAFDFKNENILTVSSEVVANVVRAKNPDAALLLLYIMEAGGNINSAQAKQTLGLDDTRFSAAVQILQGNAAAASPPGNKKPGQQISKSSGDSELSSVPLNSNPSYTRSELANAMRDPDFAFIYTQAEKAVGHPLLQYEISALMMIHDYLKMPANIIALLITHIVDQAQRRSTAQRPPTVSFRDIRAEAVRWHELGISTIAEAEQHIKELECRRSTFGRAQRVLGIHGRFPSPTEKKYIEQFIDMDPSLELIPLAYDLTVTRKGALIWPYMCSILRSWIKNGYKTAEDVNKSERGYRAAEGSRKRGAGAKDIDRQAYDERVLQFFQQNREEGE